ncbi:MAG: glutamate racemase [Clostridia bacterium]|nr:glutamate racemase [Clostridia bacterium]
MKIGVFDSGIGGLTFVKELFNLVSNVEVIYFADSLNMPYGNKSREYIINRAEIIIDFLKSKNSELIISACGTVSSVLPDLQNYKNCENIIGVVKSSCLKAAKITKNNNIGVIATELSIKEKYYEKILLDINKNFKVYPKSCPKLAEIIEHNNNNLSNKNLDYIQSCVLYFAEKNIDTLILGCTHYPVVKKIISQILNNIKIIDSSIETAKFVSKILSKKNNYNFNYNQKKIEIYTSKLTNEFILNASNILSCDLSENIYIW